MAAVLWQETEAGALVRSSGQTAVVNVEAQSGDPLPLCTGSDLKTCFLSNSSLVIIIIYLFIYFYTESTLHCSQLLSPSSILPTSRRQESLPNSYYISMGFITNCHIDENKNMCEQGTKIQFSEVTFLPFKGQKAAVRRFLGKSCRHCRLTSLLAIREAL